MIGPDCITLPVVILAGIFYAVIVGIFAAIGVRPTGMYAAIAALLIFTLPFILYRHTAIYSYGPARGDNDFGFPFRWITTQSDSNPVRFRPWALTLNCLCGVTLWLLVHTIRRRKLGAPLSTPNSSSSRHDY